MTDKPTKNILFSPITIRGVTFRNRIGVSSMGQRSDGHGNITDQHLVISGSQAMGGAGLVMLGGAAVEPAGRVNRFNIGLWTNEHATNMSRIANYVKSYGAVPGIQLAHAGRIRFINGGIVNDDQGQSIAPSAIAYSSKHVVPIEARLHDIERISNAFVSAAINAIKAGFQVLSTRSFIP